MNMNVDLHKVERVLLGNLSADELTYQESVILKREKPMFDIGRMAEISAQAYYAHMAAIIAARSEGAEKLLQTSWHGQPVPTEAVKRNNGTEHVFDSHHYLGMAREPEIMQEFSSVWLVGSLLKIGDALSVHKYFDHGPDIELLYHLRNGVAHGNRFNINNKGLDRLAKWPAHNRTARVRIPGADFEITQSLNGMPVLFNFMGPGDLLDLFLSIAIRFMRLRERLA